MAAPTSVAVTGASGFIGRRLIESLVRDGIAVRALARRRPVQIDFPTGVDTDALTVINGRLGDDAAIAELLDGVDVVVHLAGLIKARTRQAFFEANAEGTRHLAAIAAAQTRPPKLVLISSLAAREPSLSSYAASKRAGEDVLSDFGDDLSWTALRPPAVYGPGDRETLAFFKNASRGIGAMLGSEDARFSVIHVDDLVSAIRAVLDPALADHLVLQLDDGKDGGHGWRSMVASAERAFGRRVVPLRIPKAVLSALAYGNTGLRLLLPGYTAMLTPEKVRELTHLDWVANNDQIRAVTTWKPQIPIDRGFPATIDWYRLHSWL